MKKEKLILAFLVLIVFFLNYSFLDGALTGWFVDESQEVVKVVRIIDGDTIEVEGAGERESAIDWNKHAGEGRGILFRGIGVFGGRDFE